MGPRRADHPLRRRVLAVTALVLAAAPLFALLPASARGLPAATSALETWPPGSAAGRAVPGQLVVRIAPAGRRAAAARASGPGRIVRRLPRMHAVVVQVAPGSERRALARWRRLPGVRRAERDVRFRIDGAPCTRRGACRVTNDPLFPRQWSLENGAPAPDDADVEAPAAWRLHAEADGVRVAVVDTGVDATHPDLAGHVVASWHLPDSAPTDVVGHGTAVAGVIAATAGNGIGIAGVAPRAMLVVAKATDDLAGAPDEMDCSVLAEAIAAAVADGAQVVNISASGPASCRLLDVAVAQAWSAGTLVVAAAGNANRTRPEFPAALPDVVAVAATDSCDARAGFSTYGRWVELAAPGEDIVTTLPVAGSELGCRYGTLSGTSFAAPIVAGVAALLWPRTLDLNADGRVNDEVRARLLASADRIRGTGSLWQAGRVNACRAVAGRRACRARTRSARRQAQRRSHRARRRPARRS